MNKKALVLAFTALILSACSTFKRPMKDCELIYKLNPKTQQIEPTNKSLCSEQYEIWR